jgi:hypothetical protein
MNTCYPAIIRPVEARVDIKNSSGVRILTLTSLKDGTFTVHLAPGTYFLSGVPIGSSVHGEIGLTRVDVRPLRYEDLTLEVLALAVSQ